MRLAVPFVPARSGLLVGGLFVATLLLATWIGRTPLHIPLIAVAGVILFLATLVRAEAGFVILILSMLFSPEISLGFGGGSGLEGRRPVILRTDDLVLLLVGFAWIARMAIHKNLGAIRRTRLNAFIGAFVMTCLISTLVGIGAGRVRPLVGLCFVVKYVEYFIIYFMTVNYVRNEDQLRRLFIAVLVTAFLILVYAYWQIPLGGRPSAPFEGPKGEPNTLGGYIVLIFSLTTAVALTATDRRWRLCCAALSFAAVPPLLATLSRSSWLALGASMLTLLALSPMRRRLAAFAIIAVALLFFIHPDSVAERIAYTFQSHPQSVGYGALQLDPSSSARLSSWGDAIKGFAVHPVIGWGVTGFGFLDAQYFRLLVEVGLVGLAAFGALVVSTGRVFYRAVGELRVPLHRGLAIGMCAALAGLVVHAIGTNTFMLIRIMEPFWLLAGLLIVAPAIEAGGGEVVEGVA